MRLWRTLAVTTGLAIVAIFSFRAVTVQAYNGCACRCLDSESTEELTARAPTTAEGTAPATLRQICQDAHPDRGVPVSAFVRNITTQEGTSPRTICQYQSGQSSIRYTALSAGERDCRDDCASVCGGVASVDASQNFSSLPIDCEDTSDCKVGALASIKGVVCEYRPTTDARYPNGVKPTCIIRPTRDDADAECRQYGGLAKGTGSKCDAVAVGEDPMSIFVTRPYFTVNGTYAVREFTGSSVNALWTALEADGLSLDAEGGNQPGLCYTYGKNLGVDYTNMDISGTIADAVNGEPGPEASRKYACIKQRTGVCGTYSMPEIPSTMTVKTKTKYSCTPSNELPTNPDRYCFDSIADLCPQSGTRCCATGCETDFDCGAYASCEQRTGLCKPNPVCDPENETRRCRIADPIEIGESDICSPETSDLLDMAASRCPSVNQHCCEARDSRALGSCAVDMRDEMDDWQNYSCIKTEDIPSSQWVTLPNGNRELTGAYCLTSDVPEGGRATGKTIARCGQGQTCCDLSVVAADRVAALLNRPTSGACINQAPTGMTCQAINRIGERFAVENGFLNLTAYYQALGNAGYCQMTPIAAGDISNTEECASGAVCCRNLVFPGTDGSCSGAGMVLHPRLGICVDSAMIIDQLSVSICANDAERLGEPVNELMNRLGVASSSAMTCQLVDANNPTALSRCLTAEVCIDGGVALPEGKKSLCCAPGTGETAGGIPGASETGLTAQVSEGSIWLPPCIGSGNCTMDDVIRTGAQFANFLIGISGSIFLAIFIYAGFMYLTAGSSDRAKKGKTMIIQSSIGIILMLSGYVLINFLQQSLVTKATGTTAQAECGKTDDTNNMSCTYLVADQNDTAAISKEVDQRGCVRDKCPGPNNYVCCPN